MIGFVSVLALLAGAVLGFNAEATSDAVKWGAGLAVALALFRFVEFTVQEAQWTTAQIQEQGGLKFAQRSLMMILVHTVWYGCVLGAAAALAHLL
jgi:hypothetical protein